jgi:hypothetical protein
VAKSTLSPRYPTIRTLKSLPVKDRHVRLAFLGNVMATTHSRYRVRSDDPEFKRPNASAAERRAYVIPRTLEGSVIRPWRWPSVLGRKCLAWDDFRNALVQMVPPLSFVPHGRFVPTCVLRVHG